MGPGINFGLTYFKFRFLRRPLVGSAEQVREEVPDGPEQRGRQTGRARRIRLFLGWDQRFRPTDRAIRYP